MVGKLCVYYFFVVGALLLLCAYFALFSNRLLLKYRCIACMDCLKRLLLWKGFMNSSVQTDIQYKLELFM